MQLQTSIAHLSDDAVMIWPPDRKVYIRYHVALQECIKRRSLVCSTLFILSGIASVHGLKTRPSVSQVLAARCAAPFLHSLEIRHVSNGPGVPLSGRSSDPFALTTLSKSDATFDDGSNASLTTASSSCVIFNFASQDTSAPTHCGRVRMSPQILSG